MYKVLAVLVPPTVVTNTLEAPPLPAGVVAVIVVESTTATLVAEVPPMVTPVAPVKSVPVMVMAVPPAPDPVEGETFVTVGAGSGKYAAIRNGLNDDDNVSAGVVRSADSKYPPKKTLPERSAAMLPRLA